MGSSVYYAAVETISSSFARYPFEGKHVLVTGARGFLGSYFVDTLKALGATVIGLDIKDGEYGDVTRLTSWCDPLDYIVHAAGCASPVHYTARSDDTLTDAVVGTRNVLRLAGVHKARVLLLSSSEVYGEPSLVPTPESHLGSIDFRGPRASYDVGKRAAEALASIYHQRWGVDVVTVRPFNVYGPGMASDDSRVIPQFINAAIKGQPMKVHGDGEQTRTFCYVTDALTGFLMVLARGRPGAVYNIGATAPEISILELARLIAVHHFGGWAALSADRAPPPENYPGVGPSRRCPDLRVAVSELGYNPVTSLDAGLSRMIDHAYELLPCPVPLLATI